jgi:Sigma-70, region 4.
VKETEKGNIKPMTYAQIAEALGISPESVRAIEFKALREAYATKENLTSSVTCVMVRGEMKAKV